MQPKPSQSACTVAFNDGIGSFRSASGPGAARVRSVGTFSEVKVLQCSLRL